MRLVFQDALAAEVVLLLDLLHNPDLAIICGVA